ncbi:MAG: NADH-quinone oxidoreductase subunit [Actinomycetota bacterium]|jgi:NADH-quinone oxidoreductase subunit G
MTDVQQDKDTVSMTVDGKTVEAKPGEMIIAAAERNGVYIPRFCYHPRMKPVGMCRMCLVDVEGPRGMQLQPACFVPVAEGQNVVTDSPRVKKAQDGVLEFLLVNHPLDCPVCDKGGECPLQDQTFVFGPGESRFVEEKRHFEKPIPLSGLVDLDRERCIQCARCTRFADEIAGDPLIDFASRGERIEVSTFPDLPFSSYFSGNTVQICPVGALTARPYRFKARPWDLEQVESTCTSCSVGCRVAVQSSNNQLTRYLGLDSDPVNHSWLCDKGRFDFQAINSAQRVSHPMVRRGDGLTDTSWGEALDAVARGLSDVRSLHGAGAIGVIGGARLANEDAYAWARLAKAVVGTDNVDAQLGDGLPAQVVLGLPRATIDDACRAPAVILLAPDLKEELPVLYLRLRSAVVDDGLRVIEITPQHTGMTRHASVTLTHRPGEAGLVARALASGSDADVAGVPAAALAEARQLMEDGAVVVLGRPSLAEGAGATVDAAAALAALDGVTFLPVLRRANVMGALDMGLAPGVLPGRVGLAQARAWYEQAWGSVPAEAGLDTEAMLQAAAEGRLQALVLLGADPLADFPDRELAKRALAGAGFVAAVDTFLNDSAREADVVLPAAGYAERPGTTTNLEGRVTRLGQKIVPPGVAWPEWVIANELAHRLGGDLGFESIEGIWSEIERTAPAHRGLTVAMLRERRFRDGVVAPIPPEGAPETPPVPVDPMSDPGIDAVETHGETAFRKEGTEDEAEHGEALHGEQGSAPEGDDEETIETHAPTTPALAPPALLAFTAPDAQSSVPPPDAYSLRLVSGRELYDCGTLVQHSPALAPLARPARLRVNPYDLNRLGVATGGRVRLSSARANTVVEVKADDGVPRGSAALAFNVPGLFAGDLIDVTMPVTDIRIETVT